MKKKFPAIAVMAALCSASLLAVVGCKPSVSGISVATKPQTTFVKGNELDLSKGTLNVVAGGETSTVSLSDEGVTVSGYDKNAVGKQTLTISYEGQTTELTVECVERIVPDSRVTMEYFVGDELSYFGNLYVTDDDGTSSLVSMSNSAFEFTYDFSKASDAATVAVSYKKDSVSYAGAYTVAVYDATAVSLAQSPTKKNYKNYESLDLTGAKLELKNGSGTFSRTINITEDMIGDYDFTTVTEEEGTVEKTITVTYAQREVFFNVNVSYTDVLKIRSDAQELAAENYDWNQDIGEIAIGADQGEKALAAIDKYLGLPKADQAQIDEEDAVLLARIASAYGYQIWKEQAASYSDLFAFTSSNTLALVGKPYLTSNAKYSALTNTDEGKAFLALGARLAQIRAAFGGEILYSVAGETEEDTVYHKIDEYLNPVTYLDKIVGKIGYALDLYGAMNPSSGDPDYNAIIVAVSTSGYESWNDRDVYQLLTIWDEDFFDVLYLYSYGDGTEINTDAINVLKDVYLPAALEDAYEYIRYAIIQLNYMNNGYQNDTTLFMAYYRNAQEGYQSALNVGEDADVYANMCAYLAKNLTFSGLTSGTNEFSFASLIYLLKTAGGNSTIGVGGGYLSIVGTMFENKAFNDLWNDYLAVIEKIRSNDDSYKNDVPTLLGKFLDLSPAWQEGFLASLNAYYGVKGGVSLSWASSNYNYFTRMVYVYFVEALQVTAEEGSEENAKAFVILQNILLLGEMLSQGNETAFVEGWKEYVSDQYATLEGTAKELFDQHVGEIYNRYAGYYAYLSTGLAAEGGDTEGSETEGSETEGGETQTPADGEEESFLASKPELSAAMEAKFEAMTRSAVTAYSLASKIYQTYIILSQMYGTPMQTVLSTCNSELFLLYATYLNAEAIADDILTTATEAELNAYYYNTYYTGGVSLDRLLYYARSFFSEFMMEAVNGSSNYPHWLLYEGSELNDIIGGIGDLAVNSASKDTQFVTALITKYSDLSNEDKFILRQLDASGVYYNVLLSYLSGVLPENALTAASALLTADNYYYYYSVVPDGNLTESATTLQMFATKMALAYNAYSQLTTDEKAAFDQELGFLYEKHYNIYERDSLAALGETEKGIVSSVLTALNYYEAFNENPDSVDTATNKTNGTLFDENMKTATAAYDGLTEDQKTAFDKSFKLLYDEVFAAWSSVYGQTPAVNESIMLLIRTVYYYKLMNVDPEGALAESTNEASFYATLEELVTKVNALSAEDRTAFNKLYSESYTALSNFYAKYCASEFEKVNSTAQALYKASVYYTKMYKVNPYGAYGDSTNEAAYVQRLGAFVTAYQALTEEEKAEFDALGLGHKTYLNYWSFYFNVGEDASVNEVARLTYSAYLYFQIFSSNKTAKVEVNGEEVLATAVFTDAAKKAIAAYEKLTDEQKAAFADASNGNDRMVQFNACYYVYVNLSVSAVAESTELTENAKTFLEKLADISVYYYNFFRYPDQSYKTGETTKEMFVTKMQELVSLYAELTADELTAVKEVVGNAYEYYLAYYTALTETESEGTV